MHLNDPMNIMQPVEASIRGIEEVQLLILAHPDEGRAITEPNLIRYTLIKLTKTGGMHAKGIKKWGKRPPQDSRK